MKKNLLLLTIFSALTVYSVNAQQRPYYTQYILNNFIVNPAVAGIENYTDVKISHPDQQEISALFYYQNWMCDRRTW